MSKWISVEDRLPPDQQEVLVYTVSQKGLGNNDKGYWSIDRFIHRGRAKVTHWMPLPEPPDKRRIATETCLFCGQEITKKGAKMAEKKILDVTCGSRTIWFDKHHPNAIYCDKRIADESGIYKNGDKLSERHFVIKPDIQCDFTDLPFDDNSFPLVVFDPPHLTKAGETAWLVKKYGRLGEEWPKMLHDGFNECMRVLKPDGVLIFKWSEFDIPAEKVWKAIGQKPLFGHHSGKNSKTFWACFMKGGEQNGN